MPEPGPHRPLGRKERPRLRPEMTGLDRALHLLSLSVVVGISVRVISVMPDIPDSIAVHFDASGEADGFGSKYLLWVMPGAALLMYVLLTVLQRFPHTYNYAWPITAANARVQYMLAMGLLSWMRLHTTLIMAYTGWVMADAADGTSGSLGIWFLPVALGTMALTLVAYLVLASRNRRPEEINVPG